MPRIRQYKNFNFNPKDFTDGNEADKGSERYYRTSGGTEAEGASGSHWLNNAFIISTLNESHIKQAISYHKAQINLLEAELSARATGLRGQVKSLDRATSFDPAEFTFIPPAKKSKNSSKERSSSTRRAGVDRKAADKLVSKVIKELRKLGISKEELEGIL